MKKIILFILLAGVLLFLALNMFSNPSAEPVNNDVPAADEKIALGLMYVDTCAEGFEQATDPTEQFDFCVEQGFSSVPGFYVYDFDSKRSFPIDTTAQETVLADRLIFPETVSEPIVVNTFDHAWLAEQLLHYSLERGAVEYDLSCASASTPENTFDDFIECITVDKRNDRENIHIIKSQDDAVLRPRLFLEGPDYTALLNSIWF